MINGYERKQFVFNYVIGSVIFGIMTFMSAYFLLDKSITKCLVIMIIYLAAVICLFVISFSKINQAYNEIEKISSIMEDVYEGEKIPQEEYKQGDIGILYTNFYKVVSSLKESNLKEQEEKIFLRDIISDISHQLKTPLASLTVFMDLLYEDKITDNEKKYEILGEAKNQLIRMEWMVLSMLKLARIEAGAIQFVKKEARLVSILAQAKEAVMYLYDERCQTIDIDCPDDLILNCDADWLTEAVINLLKNASDYSKNGKAVFLYTEDTNVYTRIYIRDEGVGIPEKDIQNIFKRFYRVNQQVNPNSVGIGLSLVKSIVEGMGGKVTVKSSVGDESYSCFMITFIK